MKYSPLDIKNQEFNKSVRGYNVDEVTIYLESIAEYLAELNTDNEKLHSELEQTKKKLGEYTRIEKDLQTTLLTAQESSSKSVESTKKQTEFLLKESELKAAQIIDKAKEEANYIRNSVINLKEERLLLLAKLKAMVESQKKILNINSAGDKDAENKNDEGSGPAKGGINVDDILDKIL